MMVPRSAPYIHVGWLRKLIVGGNSCEWASWFKAHYQNYDKVPSDFNLASWKVNHTALLANIRSDREAEGKTVLLEDQNKFSLRGKSGITLAGVPDLIALDGPKTATIYDAKTGKPNDADVAQVMIYMWALPLARMEYRGFKFDGIISYSDQEVPVPNTAITPSFVEKLVGMIQRVGGEQPANLVPSASECRFCEITLADCPNRIESEEDFGVTDAF
jgi:hypothetical protein